MNLLSGSWLNLLQNNKLEKNLLFVQLQPTRDVSSRRRLTKRTALRANAQEKRANRGHSSKPNLPSF